MIERNSGHIVATASSRALVGKGSNTLIVLKLYPEVFNFLVISDYSAEKQALLGLMESLEDEMNMLGKDGIKFTTVCPLLTKTKLTRPLLECRILIKMF